MPFANVLGPTMIVGHPICSEYVWLLVSPIESVAVIVKENVFLCVGVPESTPAEESVRLGGSDPAVSANVAVPVPPAVVSVTGP